MARYQGERHKQQMSKIALITGAAGFTARHLASRLRQEGSVTIVALDRRTRLPEPGLFDSFVCADLTEPDNVAALVAKLRPDSIFHLAGQVVGTPASLYQANLLSTVHLLEAVRTHAPDAGMLVVGSAAEYGRVEPAELPISESQPCRPLDWYGLSKQAMTLAARHYVESFGLKVVIARPFNIVGAGVPETSVLGTVLSQIVTALRRGEAPVVRVGNLDSIRDFISVADVADAYVRLIRCEQWGEIFNICSGRPAATRDCVALALALSPYPVRLEVNPSRNRPAELAASFGSYAKASERIGFSPATPLEEAVKEAWADAVRELPSMAG
jgi:GDP-4-dehydro-6-deoxy-D-mannose reductase